jgi:hypothetical protein
MFLLSCATRPLLVSISCKQRLGAAALLVLVANVELLVLDHDTSLLSISKRQCYGICGTFPQHCVRLHLKT